MRDSLWGPVRQPVKFSKDVAIKCHQVSTLFRNSFVICWEVPELKLPVLLRMNPRFTFSLFLQDQSLRLAMLFHIQKFPTNKGNHLKMK